MSRPIQPENTPDLDLEVRVIMLEAEMRAREEMERVAFDAKHFPPMLDGDEGMR
jgi:hypothetical protein